MITQGNTRTGPQTWLSGSTVSIRCPNSSVLELTEMISSKQRNCVKTALNVCNNKNIYKVTNDNQFMIIDNITNSQCRCMDTTPHQMQTCSNMHPIKICTIKWIIWLRFLSILCFAASQSFTHLIARLERREFLHVCLCRGYPDCYLKINTRKLGILSCCLCSCWQTLLRWHGTSFHQLELHHGMTPRIQVDVLWSTSWHNVFEEFLCHLHSKWCHNLHGSLDLYDFVMYGEASCSHVWSCGAELRRAA